MQPAQRRAAHRGAVFSWTAAKVEETPELSRVLIGASETTFGAAPDSGARTARTHRAFTRVLDAGRREGNVRRDVSDRGARGDRRWQLRAASCTPGASARATRCGGGWMRRRSRSGNSSRCPRRAGGAPPGCAAVSLELPALAGPAARQLRWRRPVSCAGSGCRCPARCSTSTCGSLPAAAGRVLIDTGMNQPQTQAAWQTPGRQRAARSASSKRSWSRTITRITSAWPAHLAARFAVPVRMSAPARAAAQRSLRGTIGGSAAELARDYRDTWGVDFEALLARARARRSFDRAAERHARRDRAPSSRASASRSCAMPWQASLHFGHAEGHVCLHWPEADLLHQRRSAAAGDLEQRQPLSGAASEDPLGDFLASLERLAQPAAADDRAAGARRSRFAAPPHACAQLHAGHAAAARADCSDFLPRAARHRGGGRRAVRGAQARGLEHAARLRGDARAHPLPAPARRAARLAEGGEVRWLRRLGHSPGIARNRHHGTFRE